MLTFFFSAEGCWEALYKKKVSKNLRVFLSSVGSNIEVRSIWSAGFKWAFRRCRSYVLWRSFQLQSI